jgi:5-hydroxyisourate hydrolase
MTKDAITCHILDTVVGKPAAGVNCTLSRLDGFHATDIAQAKTNEDGRILKWDSSIEQVVKGGKVDPGRYRIRFETGDYLSKSSDGQAFFPYVEIVFDVAPPGEPHYHIPLLLANYSYSTYRGS